MGETRDYDFLKTAAPVTADPSLKEKVVKEIKNRWWIWSVVVFAVIVCGGLLMFRGSLYSQNVGMPILAVTENAQELCDSKCAEEVGLDAEGIALNKEKYETCLASCVKSESEQVAEERKDFAEEQKKEAEDESPEVVAEVVTEVVTEEGSAAEAEPGTGADSDEKDRRLHRRMYLL